MAKMTVTETVTAELLPQLPRLRGAMTDDGGGAAGGVSGAVTDAVVEVSVMVEGAAPPLSLGEQMLALSNALALAAHNATTQQTSSTTLSDASTVLAVSAILGTPVPRRRRA